MTREEVSRLLALEPLVSTPDLLAALWKAADELVAEGAPIEGDKYSILEGIDSIGGIWLDLQKYAAGESVDLISRITVFSDSGEVASWFAEMASHGSVRLSLYREAAMILLALHGLIALAAETQAEEANVDLDNEGALA
ncbi:hypothetical protein KAM339_005040 [Aeromonas caviae]|uniref:hypothetical protein n=1 Tax=Aeromonas caviae TaxID=648 RepID=UPI001CC47F79|nr:hypothetical protein [Aeromonas caviae]BDA11963.1 hypothetical protein KAM339_005040 [Aeromonas caviae]